MKPFRYLTIVFFLINCTQISGDETHFSVRYLFYQWVLNQRAVNYIIVLYTEGTECCAEFANSDDAICDEGEEVLKDTIAAMRKTPSKESLDYFNPLLQESSLKRIRNHDYHPKEISFHEKDRHWLKKAFRLILDFTADRTDTDKYPGHAALTRPSAVSRQNRPDSDSRQKRQNSLYRPGQRRRAIENDPKQEAKDLDAKLARMLKSPTGINFNLAFRVSPEFRERAEDYLTRYTPPVQPRGIRSRKSITNLLDLTSPEASGDDQPKPPPRRKRSSGQRKHAEFSAQAFNAQQNAPMDFF